MTEAQPLGPLLHSFFADHLITVKGLRPSSVRSYRDTIRLLLTFTAADKGCKITRLSLGDLSFGRIVRFLRYLEQDRRNHVRTRNQRLAALHTLFEYIAGRSPEMLAACQQVAAIPMKRVAPPETRFLERDEIAGLLRCLPRDGRLALRDRALLLFLYNTGARVQEAADLRAGHLDLGEHPVVRRHAAGLDDPRTGRRISPHTFRHTAPSRSRGRGQRDPGLARSRRPDHDQPLCRDQHESQAGGTPGRRAARYFGGIPHQADLADRRIPAQLARLALTVMWPTAAAPRSRRPGHRGPCRRQPHNAAGRITGTT